ncbi:MAG: EAL and HDOD domain-containing protein [Vicinamibacterales bacterium]
MQINLDPRERVYVARQPILFPSGQVFGYELLYRAAAADTACVASGDLAGARVLTDALLNLGLENLTDGRTAFINVTRQLLLAGVADLLPKSAAVIELREDIAIDKDVIELCRQLNAGGYALALDDFEPGSAAELLLPHVKYVKVDVLATSAAQRAELARRLLPLGIKLVAEKVETEQDVHEARQSGYGLLQGYFFCKPTTIGGGSIPSERLSYLQILAAVNRTDVGIAELEEIIKRDATLSYRVLRSINSAAFGVRQEIRTIRQALVMLGVGRIRQWASVWALAGVHTTGSPETLNSAVIRGRCCEQIITSAAGPEVGSECFLLGLCSMLDVMLARPMQDIVTELPIADEIRDALTGTPNTERALLDAVVAYEKGDWAVAADAAEKAEIEIAAIQPAYEDALRWSHELSKVAKAA